MRSDGDGRGEGADLTPSLVVRLRAGDDEAGRLLDALYRAAVHRLCVGYLHAPQEADDAVQDVFQRVLQAGEVPDRFRPWLYRIARNHCLNLLRARRRRRDVAPIPSDTRLQPAASHAGFLSALVAHERQHRLDAAFAVLSASEQELLRLRYGEGLARAEIAEVVDLPEPTVKSRLYEAVARLRARLLHGRQE